MMKSLNNLIPMILALALTTIIFIPINKKLNISSKIAPYIPVSHEYKALFFIGSTLLLLLLVGLLGIYIIPMSDLTYCIFTGIIAGIGISITTELSPKHCK